MSGVRPRLDGKGVRTAAQDAAIRGATQGVSPCTACSDSSPGWHCSLPAGLAGLALAETATSPATASSSQTDAKLSAPAAQPTAPVLPGWVTVDDSETDTDHDNGAYADVVNAVEGDLGAARKVLEADNGRKPHPDPLPWSTD